MAKPRLAPFIICSGTEEFDLDFEIDKARSSKSRQVIFLEGKGLESVEIVTACEEYSFMDERPRLVIVDNAEGIKKTEALEEYIEEKSPEDLSTILLAICRPSKKGEVKLPEVWTKAAAKGTSKTFHKLKPWDLKGKQGRLDKEAAALGIVLGKGINELLLKVVGDDLYVLVNELKKLSLLVGPHGTVTTEHVQRVVASQPPATPYEVADAACEKNVKLAMNLVAHLYRYNGDDASVPIASALMHHVERLIVARSLLDVGKSKDEIASQMGMNAYRLQNTFLLWSNRHSVKSLQNNLANLCRLDANVKGPARSKRTLVELAVLSVAS
jgi:DNA polymerase III delta subunit